MLEASRIPSSRVSASSMAEESRTEGKAEATADHSGSKSSYEYIDELQSMNLNESFQ